MHPFLLNDILVIILLSVAVLYLWQRMWLHIIVGFLLTGVIAGPHGFVLVREIEAVKTLAEEARRHAPGRQPQFPDHFQSGSRP
jgi:Kef-type K+ transport system membrane component KefB